MAYTDRHSHLKKKKYFEGWYFKQQNNEHTIAIIPGISIDQTGNKRPFIQVIGNDFSDWNFYDTYTANKKELAIQIENNFFSDSKISIDFSTDKIKIKGELTFSSLIRLKKCFLSPGIMGPFSYLSFMECYHGITSLNHYVNGKLLINDKEVIFNNGKGYIEHDFGRSFPLAYLWAQSNSFPNENNSFFVSYAKIPFLGLNFKGLIAVLLINGKQYRFATYNLARIKVLQKENSLFLLIKKRAYKLEVELFEQGNGSDLVAPKEGKMDFIIKESLKGTISLRLFKKSKLLYEETSKNAGIEHRNIELLLGR